MTTEGLIALEFGYHCEDASTNAIVPPGRETLMSKHKKFFRACACCEQAALPQNPQRRSFLAGGVAALGLGATAAAGRVAPALGQAPAAAPAKTRIDVHHH